MAEHDDVEILLAEDNSQDAELMMRAFRQHNLLNKVHWVKDGVEVLDFVFSRGAYSGRAQDRLPRVLLLDLKMPRMDGLDVLRALKKDERTLALPVVVVTSSNQERDVVESYRHGVNGYVVKPVGFADFSRVVSQIGMYWLLVNAVPHLACTGTDAATYAVAKR